MLPWAVQSVTLPVSSWLGAHLPHFSHHCWGPASWAKSLSYGQLWPLSCPELARPHALGSPPAFGTLGTAVSFKDKASTGPQLMLSKSPILQLMIDEIRSGHWELSLLAIILLWFSLPFCSRNPGFHRLLPGLLHSGTSERSWSCIWQPENWPFPPRQWEPAVLSELAWPLPAWENPELFFHSSSLEGDE